MSCLGGGVHVEKAGAAEGEGGRGHGLGQLAELPVAFAQGARGAVQLGDVALQTVVAVQQVAAAGAFVIRRAAAPFLGAAILRVHGFEEAVPLLGKGVE